MPLRALSAGAQDVDTWRVGDGGLPQVTKAWDDRRRASQFAWEASDPTSEATPSSQWNSKSERLLYRQ